MNNLKLHKNFTNQTTIISNIFIDQYMPLANGEFVKVYIYLLRCLCDEQMPLSISHMADLFNQTEADVIRALKFWDKTGALHLTYDNTTHTVTDITLCDLYSASYDDITESDNAVAAPVKPEDVAPIKPTVDTRTAYTPAKLLELKASDDFKMLLYALGMYLGSELSQPDASTIAYIYDTLGFKSDLIEFLVEYCVARGHKSMRYIEKTALAWAEQGVSTVAEAKVAANNHNEVTFSVLGAFGINNRAAGKYEQDYIKKWTDVYCFSNDIIVEACNRTLRAIHQPSFEYADSILTKWNNANVKDVIDIKKLDAAFDLQQSNSTKASRQVSSTTAKVNKFNNFPQRDIDIDSLESMLISNK